MIHELTFRARLWLYEGSAAGSWHFITLPRNLSKQVKDSSSLQSTGATGRAHGTVKVTATIGETRWRTSIFPARKLDAYVLPVKAGVRQRERLQAGMMVEVLLVLDS